MPEGITTRHQRSCSGRGGGRCDCAVTYQAQVYDRVSGKRKTKTFGSEAAAKGWRVDAIAALRRGTMVVGRSVTVRQAWAEWLEDAKAGLVRNRSGDTYKPKTLRGYETSMRERILPLVGPVKLQDLRRADLQRIVSRLQAAGLDPSTVRNAIIPLRALYRRAVSLDDVAFNPTIGLELPAVRGRRDRIVGPDVAGKLLAQLPVNQRALWGTALYAGLRHGELRALRWENVDLATGVIDVVESWDDKEGVIEPKSEAGRRRVPIPAILRDVLLEHQLEQGRKTGLAFGRDADTPFASQVVNDRADVAWGRERKNGKWIGKPKLRLHGGRHSYASFMIAAGVNAKALQTFMGHSSITITMDRYGHLFPGAEDEVAALLDGFLERANSEARKAAVGR